MRRRFEKTSRKRKSWKSGQMTLMTRKKRKKNTRFHYRGRWRLQNLSETAKTTKYDQNFPAEIEDDDSVVGDNGSLSRDVDAGFMRQESDCFLGIPTSSSCWAAAIPSAYLWLLPNGITSFLSCRQTAMVYPVRGDGHGSSVHPRDVSEYFRDRIWWTGRLFMDHVTIAFLSQSVKAPDVKHGDDT